ncbi:MAG: hypothetical protein WC121_02815 [Candidatus Kapaibacterium sp.]
MALPPFIMDTSPSSEATSPFLMVVSHPCGAWSLSEVEVSAGEWRL